MLWYINCAQGFHEDAARTYLATLKQNPSANHIWSYLRISLSNMDRPGVCVGRVVRNFGTVSTILRDIRFYMPSNKHTHTYALLLFYSHSQILCVLRNRGM